MPGPFFKKKKIADKIIALPALPTAKISKDEEFCEKWGVTGKRSQYPCWREFAKCIENELQEGHYYKLLWQVQSSLELHDKAKSILLSNKPPHTSLKTTPLFDKPPHKIHTTTTDQEGMELSARTHHNEYTFPQISKTEMKIWTGDNLMKLLNDIKHSLDITAIYDIKKKFVKPMLVIIDEARKKNGHAPLPAHSHTLDKLDKLELDLSKGASRPRSNSV